MIRLWEAEFSRIPADSLADLKSYSRGPFTTLVIEELFTQNRQAFGCNKKGSHELVGVWHHSAMGARVLEQFDFANVHVGAGARSCGQSKLPSAYFHADQDTCILGEDRPKDTPADPWPNVTPANLRMSALAWQLALCACGDFSRVQKASLALLLIPCTLAFNLDTQDAKLAV